MSGSSKKRDSRLRLEIGETRITVEMPGSKAKGAALPVAEWLLFTPTEEKVIRLLVERGAMSREEIAVETDESTEGRLKAILASLTARRVLKITDAGYLLNVPPGGKKSLREWIKATMGDEEGEAEGVPPG